jgi:hypothetical protein
LIAINKLIWLAVSQASFDAGPGARVRLRMQANYDIRKENAFIRAELAELKELMQQQKELGIE